MAAVSAETQIYRSGGVDIDAANAIIAGDVVGGDKIINAVGENAQINYFTASPQINTRSPSAKPLPQPRNFTGRSAELKQLDQSVRARQPVVLYGPEGAGKTALLQKLTDGEAARSFQDGIVAVKGIDVTGKLLSPNDLVQRWFDQLYESIPHCLVDVSLADAYLKRRQALVVLDDVSIDSLATLEDLVNLGSAGATVIAWPALPASNLVEPLKIGPLSHEDAVQLLAARLKLAIDPRNSASLDQICCWLADMPLAIITVSSIVNDQSLSLDQVESALASIVISARDPLAAGVERAFGLAYSVLTPLERRVLQIVAVAPGLLHDPDRLAQILLGTIPLETIDKQTDATGDQAPSSGVTLHSRRHGVVTPLDDTLPGGDVDTREAQAALNRLEGLGILYANSPRLRMAAGLRPLARRGADEAQIMEWLTAYLRRDAAAGKFREREYCLAELGNVLGSIQWAAEHQHWNIVVELGRAIDPYLMLSGLWDAWESVLERVGQAASQIGDRALEAWVLHQSGTRAGGLRQTQKAIDLLHQALDIRQAIRDDAGAKITEHNLNVLMPPPPGGSGNGSQPVPPHPPFLRRAVKVFVAIGLLAAAALFGGYALAQSKTIYPPTTTALPTATPRPVVTLSTMPEPTATRLTPIPTATPPTATATSPTVTASPTICQQAGEYIADVTIPDGTQLASGKKFTKTWRVRNNGACAWGDGTRLVFANGSQMNGPAAVAVPAVAPGETVDISIDLTAPAAAGSYASKWLLIAADGTVLTPLTVVIKIPVPLVAPQLVAPATGEQVDCVSSQSLTLSWTDPNQLGNIVYEWELSDQKYSGGTTPNQSVVVSLACNLKYTWRVRVVDSAGNPGPWSDYANFVVLAAPPADTTGPDITGYVATPDPAFYKATSDPAAYSPRCSNTTMTMKVHVKDPSGVSRVFIDYQYGRDSSKDGSQFSIRARAVGPDTYQAEIDNDAYNFVAERSLDGRGGEVLWKVRAIDKLGNQTKSGEQFVTIEKCR